MNTVSATFFFAVLRALLAGYGGWWFLPVVAGEAVNASLAFLCIAVGHWALRKLAKSDQDPAERVMYVATFAVLFAAFGKGWLEPHSGLSSLLDVDAKLNPPLILVGLLIGVVSERVTRTLGPSARTAALWATTGWLIVGPLLYADFDSVVADRRLLGAGVVTAGFAAVALVIAMVGRVVGVNGLRNALAAVAIGALVFTALGPSPVAGGARPDAPSVLLIVVDTLRADMLEAADGTVPHPMPRLADIARRGIRFTNAVAPSPWTLPSTATIVSGMNPYRHRVGALAGDIPLRGVRDAFHLAPTLRAAGYQSAYLVNNPYLRPYYGFDDGTLLFRRYRGSAHDGVALARSWITRHDYRPFFTMLHLMDPHWPYEAPSGFGEQRRECEACDDLVRLQYVDTDADTRAEVFRRYRAEVAFTDYEIGRLYDELDKHGLLERTWVIVTSDHGEELWDHNHFLHGHTLYDELLRVPLVVVPPRGSDVPTGRVIDRQVLLEDIAPTILEIALGSATTDQARVFGDGSMASTRIDGRSLLEYLTVGEGEEDAIEPRPALLGFLQVESQMRFGVRGERYKVIDWGNGKFRLLYDLTSDPGEKHNIVSVNHQATGALRAVPRRLALDPIKNPARIDVSGAADTFDADLAAELRSLGYLE